MSDTNQNTSVFSTLSTISVKEKIERKGNLDYLSWANAWAMLKAVYPDAQRKVYEHDHTGFNYFTDGKSAYVKVGIIVNGLEHIDYLPVMDFRNNAIPIEKVTAMDVNKTIQRSTAKAIAMHGLGLSLWTGEDIPELTTSAPAPTKAPAKTPAKAEGDASLIELKKGTENWEKVVKYIEANKGLGIEAIGKQLNRKYKMSPAIKKEIANLFKSESNG
jgi:hypothetical protein